jgi:NNP family nitrate/nitrite transporter-like MFS transporter
MRSEQRTCIHISNSQSTQLIIFVRTVTSSFLIFRKKYSIYSLKVDPNQDDKATEIKFCSIARPHMRAFHCAWLSYFMAVFMWFSIAPLLSEIQETLDLSKEQIWTSSIVGVTGTMFVRFLMGPICDKVGPRVPYTFVLCLASVPAACIGFVNSSAGLSILRLFIGAAGGGFVMTQFWMSRMFAKEIVGTANALTAGWGNLGERIATIS